MKTEKKTRARIFSSTRLNRDHAPPSILSAKENAEQAIVQKGVLEIGGAFSFRLSSCQAPLSFGFRMFSDYHAFFTIVNSFF
ncbi:MULTISPECIES: hypothetical protein [Sporosarcina]|uniref:hypothetical protein n=1 Tax=Sporosarcina TaxID=1569 RepID=UPI001181BEAB|nr:MULTISPECIES: hypothetical protein [Sporosarcina]WJY27682.1 hypothetical protein QWT68_01390 [Sporosarcina sp. 0.2-SM1T-5]